jgi:hypothetical protein
VNPSKQIAGTMKSNRRQVSVDIRFFMYLGTSKTIGPVNQCYDWLSHMLIVEAKFHGILDIPRRARCGASCRDWFWFWA